LGPPHPISLRSIDLSPLGRGDLASAAVCACIYLGVVVGLFRLTEPLRIARSVLQGRLRSKQ